MHQLNAKSVTEIESINVPYGSFTRESDFALVSGFIQMKKIIVKC